MSNNGSRIAESDVTDACEQWSISYRSPTPPPPGSKLISVWWCRVCHHRYGLGVTSNCLNCSVRFHPDNCRSLWFHVTADGHRTAFVWNQRFRRPNSLEAASALEQYELEQIEAEAGVVALSDDEQDEDEEATRTREGSVASATGGLVEGGGVPDAASGRGGRAGYPEKLVN